MTWNPALQDSPPAAGCFLQHVSFRRSAIHAELFCVIGRLEQNILPSCHIKNPAVQDSPPAAGCSWQHASSPPQCDPRGAFLCDRKVRTKHSAFLSHKKARPCNSLKSQGRAILPCLAVPPYLSHTLFLRKVSVNHFIG